MSKGTREYLFITSVYWCFTLTDGAVRMLVLLYFHERGFSPIELALLFLLYELFGIFTNLFGGWLGARVGLVQTLRLGLILQIGALAGLSIAPEFLTPLHVAAAQALCGIAKDLVKTSAKSSIKVLARDNPRSSLFRWVAALTGSKNALKGAGFFLGAMLLQTLGFASAMQLMGAALVAVLLGTLAGPPPSFGRASRNLRWAELISEQSAVNWLSAARLFLFASRDVWFVVALPIYLHEYFHWSYIAVGSFLALWVIGYGIVQACAPLVLKLMGIEVPQATSALILVFLLLLVPGVIALVMSEGEHVSLVIIMGLAVYAVIFALNSAVHSFLVLDYTQADAVAMSIGFYYTANAAGRLLGTLLSGAVFQYFGISGALWCSCLLLAIAAGFTLRLKSAVARAAGRT